MVLAYIDVEDAVRLAYHPVAIIEPGNKQAVFLYPIQDLGVSLQLPLLPASLSHPASSSFPLAFQALCPGPYFELGLPVGVRVIGHLAAGPALPGDIS